MKYLRIWDENNLDEEGYEEENLPEVVKARFAWVFDDQVALAPVSLRLVVLLSVSWHNFVIINLEEELHEVFVAIPVHIIISKFSNSLCLAV